MNRLRGYLEFALTAQLLLCCWVLCCSLMNAAQAASTTTAPGQEKKTPLNLDLGSSSASVSGALLPKNSVSIMVGSTRTTVTNKSTLTPAEYLAAVSVIATGRQTLTVNGSGQATRGTFLLPSSSNLASITVPQGITGAYNAAAAKNLSFTGNFTNSGSFYLVSSKDSVKTVSLSALNIINNPGAILSSLLPAGGIAGFSDLLFSVGTLNIHATNNITNYGIISSPSQLNLSAGAQIANLTSGAANPLPSISSTQALSMIAPTIINQGQINSVLNNVAIQTLNLTNAGLLQALKGNVSISNLEGQVLAVNNIGGLIGANNTLSFTNNFLSNPTINVTGGILQAANIAYSAPGGTVAVNVVDTSRTNSFEANNISINVQSGSTGLNLSGLSAAKSVALTYAGAGDVVTGGFKTLGNDVQINTTGSITVNGTINTTPNANGNGGAVTLTAGSNVSVGDILTKGTGSGSGGNITLTAGTDIRGGALDASGGISNGAPGIITLSGGTKGAGDVTVSSITANGTGGMVSIQTPDSINVSGTISANGGSVTLQSATTSVEKIDVGNGNINLNPTGGSDGSPYVLNLNQLAEFGTGNVTIGGTGGLNSDIVITGNCNQCLGNISSLTLHTDGTYTATGTTLTLAPNQSFDVIASNGIYTGSVSGGSSVSFESQGIVTVDGSISTGHLGLSGSGFSINAPVSGTSVNLSPTTSTTIEGSQLSQISATTLSIGSGSGNANVTLNGAADLSNVSSHVIVALGNGNFNSTNSPITMSSQANLIVSAANIDAGKITGGTGVVLNALHTLNVTADINVPNGPVVLNGDLSATGGAVTLVSGATITGSSIAVSSGIGPITSGANIHAVDGALTMTSGGVLTILDQSHLSATQDLTLNANSSLTIGSGNGNGVSLNAGTFANSFDPFSSNAPFDPKLISSSGSVLIDSYQGGDGTGDVFIGSNVSIVAAGDGKHAVGSVGVLSGGNLSVSPGSKLAAVGGDLWFSAASNVSIDGGKLVSLSNSSANSGADYAGGQIGIMTGAPKTNMIQLLSHLAQQRGGVENVSAPGSLDNNHITMTDGSTLNVVAPSGIQVSLSGNTMNLSGGVVYIDPPATSNVNVSNTTFSAAGPKITAPPLVIGGGTGGGGTGTGGTGTGGTGTGGTGTGGTGTGGTGTGGTGTGSTGTGGTGTGGTGSIPEPPVTITGSFGLQSTSNSNGLNGSTPEILSATITSSSVNQSDLSSRNQNSQQLQTTLFNGQSSVAIDTLDESPLKPQMKPAIFCSKPQLLKVSDVMEEDSWIIASSSCQPFTFEEHDGSLIVGTGPAKFAPAADHTLLLKEGKMLVITVDKIHVVRTPYCNITIPVNTASIIEVDPQGMVRIANLAGGKASITICRNDETLILSAAPGDQLVLAENAVPEEDFSSFAFPEVTHSKVAAWNLELSGLRGQKVHFDRNEMAQHEPLLHCSMGCVNQMQLRRIEQLMQSMTSQDTVLKSMAPTTGKGKQLLKSAVPVAIKDQLRPVSFAEAGMVTAEPLMLRSLNVGTATVRYSKQCKVSINSPGLIELTEGEALVSASKRTIVRMGQVHVELKPGTLAVITQHDGLLTVRNIYESKGTSVVATVAGKKKFGLQVGHELIVGPKGISLTRALGEDPVGRRKLASVDLASGHTCISSEISLSSLMQNSPVLAQLLRSQDVSDLDMARRILKMAVCISVVTSGHGSFSMMKN